MYRLQIKHGRIWAAGVRMVTTLSLLRRVLIATVRKIIELVMSTGMGVAVVVMLMQKVRRECRCSFYVLVAVLMLLTLGFIVGFALDSGLRVLSFLYKYFYNAYFSVIVLKLALKYLDKVHGSSPSSCLYRLTIGIFVCYEVGVLACVLYTSIRYPKDCFQLPYLVISALSLLAALVFALLGFKYSLFQEAKLDSRISSEKQNNPMPRFKLWILINCVGQVFVLIESILFEANNCVYSQDETVNAILQLIFIFASFHIGMMASILFFLYHPPDNDSIRPASATVDSNSARPIQIEMTYFDESIKSKMGST